MVGYDGASQDTFDTLIEVGLAERQLGYQALDALDTKAGILLAANAVLIGFATQASNQWLRGIAILAFASAAVPALWALAVRKYEHIDVSELVAHYRTATPKRVREQVLRELADRDANFTKKQHGAARKVTVAFWITAASLATLAVATFIPS